MRISALSFVGHVDACGVLRGSAASHMASTQREAISLFKTFASNLATHCLRSECTTTLWANR